MAMALPSATLLSLGSDVSLDVAWFTEHVGAVASVSVAPESVVYGRMGTIFPVELHGHAEGLQRVIVKRVVPSELSRYEHMGAFLRSVRVEWAFYGRCRDRADALFPRVFGPAYERPLGSGNATEDSGGTDVDVDVDVGFLLVMEELTHQGYFHIKCAKDEARVTQALDAFAELFGGGDRLADGVRFFRDSQRERRRERLGRGVDSDRSEAKDTCVSTAAFDAKRGGFWVLDRRPASEVAEAEATWVAFLERFGPSLPAELAAGVQRLGPALAAEAVSLQDEVRARCFGVIHGDAKSWNLFYSDQGPVKLIDLQWLGFGHPLQDLVYYLATSVDCDALLSDPAVWAAHVRAFRRRLEARIDAAAAALRVDSESESNLDADADSNSDSDAALLSADFREAILCRDEAAFAAFAEVCFLDYSRVVLLGLWRRLTPDVQQANKEKIGISLVTSSEAQMRWILRHTAALLEKRKTTHHQVQY